MTAVRPLLVRRAIFLLCLGCLPLHASSILPLDAGTYVAPYAGSYASSYAGSARTVYPPALPPGGGYVSLGEGLHVQGQPMLAWYFDTPGSVDEVAAWLSKGQPALRDMLVVPGTAILAGTDDARQWTARLSDGGSGRTRGTVSALSLRDRPVAQPSLPWTLGGGRLHFETRSREDKGAVIQQVWTHAAAPVRLWQQLQASLQAAGWQESTAQNDGARAWSRAATRLSLVVAPASVGSGVLSVLHVDE